ncbi:AGC family protein kinase [Tritrichomonas foetus]|uniref:AGC family protein kinase n=1 Tax=Tritrichomonas foetus TaxID=1144522 RepID=A0A1J4KYS0_9EUKA|nr:AGC family protein kinase [Tritrichomonas foetus]|eukprot:OHT16393.1 AGC family protein kinase [Tritrichomonas foetus]
MDKTQEITMEDFKIIRTLGEGNFGSVFLAIFKPTGDRVALKRMKKEDHDTRSINRFRREIRIMRKISHPSVPRFYGTFETDTSIFIVMEYINGTSLTEIVRGCDGVPEMCENRLPEKIAMKYFVELICILKNLHTELKIVHRDLKLDNIIIDMNERVRILDFGLSNMDNTDEVELHNHHNNNDNNSKNESKILFETACGTIAYVAPEMIKRENYTEKVDIWSTGVVLYSMLTGKLPFYHENIAEACRMIVEDQPLFPSFLNHSAIELLSALLSKSPKSRPTLDEILAFPIVHDTFNEHHSICGFLLHPSPIESILSCSNLATKSSVDVSKHNNDQNDHFLQASTRKDIAIRIKSNTRYQEHSPFFKCVNSSNSFAQINQSQSLKQRQIMKFRSVRRGLRIKSPPPQEPVLSGGSNDEIEIEPSIPRTMRRNNLTSMSAQYKSPSINNNLLIVRPQFRRISL